MDIGTINELKIIRYTDNGAYLEDQEANEVLLPNKYLSEDLMIGDSINVFLYTDSQDRIVATTLTPHAMKNDFACLEIKDVNNIGAFLDWGLEKDLMVPFSEQNNRLKKGQWVLVYVYLDSITHRMTATSKVYKYTLNQENIELDEGQEVEILIGDTSVYGINAIIENKYAGLLYENEVFEELLKGSKRKAFVKKIREDGKIDLSLRKTGLDMLEDGSQMILEKLELNKGSLMIDDKSTPEEIMMVMQMSKKSFKRSLGMLYKKNLVEIGEGQIKLVKK